MRRCSRTACGKPAVATLTYVYADSTAVVGPLAAYAEPHCYDLCLEHAHRLTAPRGWEVVRLEVDENAYAPSIDDLEALANAVREAGRPPADKPAARRPRAPPPPGPPGPQGRRGHLRVAAARPDVGRTGRCPICPRHALGSRIFGLLPKACASATIHPFGVPTWPVPPPPPLRRLDTRRSGSPASAPRRSCRPRPSSLVKLADAPAGEVPAVRLPAADRDRDDADRRLAGAVHLVPPLRVPRVDPGRRGPRGRLGHHQGDQAPRL